MTIVASLSVALLLFIGFYGREIPVVIYTAIGLLIAMAAWQIQTLADDAATASA